MGEMRKDQRRYLTRDELRRPIEAVKDGRYGQRDATLILVMARHGLRVSEACELRWGQIDFTAAHLHVRRLKGGTASVHPIQGDELRQLRELRRNTKGSFVFASERNGPMTRSNVSKMIEAAGERAGIRAHPHMLRHTCGHLLADAGHDTRRLQLWLGHKDIKHIRGVLAMTRAKPMDTRIIVAIAKRIALKRFREELRKTGTPLHAVRLVEAQNRMLEQEPEIYAEARAEYRRMHHEFKARTRTAKQFVSGGEF